MSTRNVERELTTLLHRHAEDAMNDTDTQTERERLHDVLGNEPRVTRTPLLVAAAAAALAVVGTIAVWTTSFPDNWTVSPAPPAPSNDLEREADAEALADQFMVAYVERDLATVNAITRVGAWGDVGDDFDADLATKEGWQATYFPEPCAATAATYVAVVVECEASLHIMGSEETGVGPFRRNIFTFVVRDGQIIEAGNTHPHTTNGMGDYLSVVTDWVLIQASPAERALLDSQPGDLSDTDVEQWVDLWSQSIDAYVAAHPSEGKG